MFDIIRKKEFFECLDAGHASRSNFSLKGIQDGWIIGQLAHVRGARILEVGGGDSRVLPRMQGNALWNVDKFEGVGQGPLQAAEQEGVKIVKTFMGEFSPEVPQVDIIFSISVIEHIPFEGYSDAFLDMARCLAPGGAMYHVVDLPLADEPLKVADQRIRDLKKAVEGAGLRWRQAPVLDAGLVFQSDMASNSDVSTWSWTKISHFTKHSGPLHQFVSIKMIADKA